jgi:quinolinate synthase
MKKITLEKLRDSLSELKTEVVLPAETADRARNAIAKMLELS